MATLENEEDHLRSVALQNAQSILAARRRAEEALRKQSEWLRITLASIGDAVISTDAEGRVTLLNGVAETLTGWSQTEAIGRPLPDVLHIVHARTRERVEDPAREAVREGTIVGLPNHTVLIARDGTERPIDDTAAPIRDETGTLIGTVVVFRDVTEREHAEAMQARLAAIVESSDDAIVSKTLDGMIRSWNSGAERLFGYTADEAIGRPITLIIPVDRQDEEYEILARIASGERVDHFETVRVTKQGRLLDISLTVSPIRDSAGRVVGASKVARDITDRKLAEEVLREADRRKDRFLALLAHELRNPLAPLGNALQMMRLADRNANSLAQARAMMERQLAHMIRLIDDLLDISRIGQNKLELRRQRVHLADVVSSAVETASSVIQAAGHRLHLSLPTEPVVLDADLTRLAQVLSNLLTNSAKYTEPGGEIRLSARRLADDLVISVRDNGIGIPTHALERIFDMFSQVDRSIERSMGGLGIGLALVKSLTEMHGGTVTASSEGEGRGSEFTVRIPMPSGNLEPRSEPSVVEAEPQTYPKRRILVVDDNRDAGESLAEMLQLVGNEVALAYDGLEAVERASDFRPDVILMDVGMPRLNGLDATSRIREQPWGKSVVIIALTGWGQDSDRALSNAAGCNGHLVKPASLSALQQLLGELDDGPG